MRAVKGMRPWNRLSKWPRCVTGLGTLNAPRAERLVARYKDYCGKFWALPTDASIMIINVQGTNHCAVWSCIDKKNVTFQQILR
jgi:hypothetical protein